MNRIKYFFQHFFLPQEHNQYKPRLLHTDFLTVVLVVLLSLTFALKYTTKQWHNVLGVSMNITVQELLNYTNEERKNHGLSPLIYNPVLGSAADQKARHMLSNNYWAHFAPDGTSPWSFFERNDYRYSFAGENLAKDFLDSKSIVNAWMNSEKHRENILQAQYKEVGFAIEEGMLEGKPTVLVVQFFATPEPGQKVQEITPPIASSPSTLASTSVVHTPKVDTHLFSKRLAIIVLGAIILALVSHLYYLERRGLRHHAMASYAHVAILLVIIIGIIVINPGKIL